MKRIIALLLLLLLPLCGCRKEEPSPIGDYDSLEALEAVLSHPLYLPSLPGWTAVGFTLAERGETVVTFRSGEKTFAFRMRPGEGHPSDPASALGGCLTVGQLPVSYCGKADAITDAWWTAGDYGYGIVPSVPFDAETVEALIVSVR